MAARVLHLIPQLWYLCAFSPHAHDTMRIHNFHARPVSYIGRTQCTHSQCHTCKKYPNLFLRHIHSLTHTRTRLRERRYILHSVEQRPSMPIHGSNNYEHTFKISSNRGVFDSAGARKRLCRWTLNATIHIARTAVYTNGMILLMLLWIRAQCSYTCW